MTVYKFALIDPDASSSSSKNKPTFHRVELIISPELTIVEVFTTLCKTTFNNLFSNSDTSRGLNLQEKKKTSDRKKQQ